MSSPSLLLKGKPNSYFYFPSSTWVYISGNMFLEIVLQQQLVSCLRQNKDKRFVLCFPTVTSHLIHSCKTCEWFMSTPFVQVDQSFHSMSQGESSFFDHPEKHIFLPTLGYLEGAANMKQSGKHSLVWSKFGSTIQSSRPETLSPVGNLSDPNFPHLIRAISQTKKRASADLVYVIQLQGSCSFLQCIWFEGCMSRCLFLVFRWLSEYMSARRIACALVIYITLFPAYCVYSTFFVSPLVVFPHK
jgi:hypothetical protein